MRRQKPAPRRNYVIRPGGRVLTVYDLPPANGARWVVGRKADLIAAVGGGLLSLDEACRRYRLSREEFHAWRRMIDKSGMPGLRATYIRSQETVGFLTK
jgi:hypothetical protein